MTRLPAALRSDSGRTHILTRHTELMAAAQSLMALHISSKWTDWLNCRNITACESVNQISGADLRIFKSAQEPSHLVPFIPQSEVGAISQHV